MSDDYNNESGEDPSVQSGLSEDQSVSEVEGSRESDKSGESEPHSDSEEEEEKDFRIFKDRQPPKPSTERITAPFLSKYEKARVVGVRAVQISRNAPIYVDPGDETDPMVIAEKELVEGKVPFVIRRYLPDNSYQDWPLKQLKQLN